MDESSRTEAPARHAMAADDGWCLEKNSWAFHRSAFRILGHPLAFGEYGHLRRQISSGEAELLRFGDQGGLYRTRLRDGTVLDVLARARKTKKGVWHTLTLAMRPGGRPRSVARPAPVPPTPPVVEVPAPPPPASIRRSSTLTLGSAASSAAEVLAARMQPKPLPPRLGHAPVQKSARAQAPR